MSPLHAIPAHRQGDGACGPAALFALLGGERPSEHRSALRQLGWRTPCSLSIKEAKAYLRHLRKLHGWNHFPQLCTRCAERADCTWDHCTHGKPWASTRPTLLAWVRTQKPGTLAMVCTRDHWLAVCAPWVACSQHPEPQPITRYPKRRAKVDTVLWIRAGEQP